MTIHSGHITVRVSPDGITTISTNTADLELTDHEVLDLIDSLAEIGHAEYMLSSARCTLVQHEDEERNPWIACYNSLAENNK